ncbi:hypothetical protein V6N11_071484 [Hibiscus sabdariffa]|uniref:CCHC-type domain-containing protein n=1 Tax=Hibiscus sabdariffa TaxID=183260 RepID=A0ABR2U0R7_9ROSI
MANNTISLRSLLEKEKLNGINFHDWFRNLRIVLKQERKEYVIEEAVPNNPGPNAPRADKDKFKKLKGGVSKYGKCFHCGKTGHWKRNCPIYLEDVKKAKAVGASVSGTAHEKDSS